jgi:hypothetical protein
MDKEKVERKRKEKKNMKRAERIGEEMRREKEENGNKKERQ